MSETYTGTVVELGGEELGRSGHAKPRKVVVKADPSAQYGKTLRVWQDSDAWEALSKLNGKHVTVIYEVEERQGGPQGSYVQNMIVGVDSDGSEGAGSVPANGSDWTPPVAAGTPAPSENTWGAPPQDTWGVGPTQTVTDPSLAAVQERMADKVSSKDDYWERREAQDEARTREIEAAWAIGVLLPHVPADQLHQEVHRLIVFKHQIAKELADG